MIKWFIKWTFRLIFLVVVLAVVLLLSLDSILKTVLEREIRARTGMEATIGTLDVGLFSPTLSIEDCRVYNTAEFGGTPFVNVPELYLEYNRGALFHHKFHVTLMRLNMAEVGVVRSDTGTTNIASGELRVPGKIYRKWERWFGGIDVLNLSLGKARYLDLKNPQFNREVNLGLKDQVFKNVDTLADLRGILFHLWMRGQGGAGGVAAH